jgi:2-polyprenyl-3-methyl-5-hydroxy-6-metoxy-1,4-benzoquinol methylase
MDPSTKTMHDYYAGTFKEHGATAKGVDWKDENEMLFRYDKMLAVMQKDFTKVPAPPSLLDVGCGWGGLLRRACSLNIPLKYTGIDVVETMVEHGRIEFKDATFLHQDVFALESESSYDFVVGNGIFTQKLDVTNPEMERFTRKMMRKMFQLCRHGVAFNMMSTRVNFMVNNLFYQNPSDLLSWLLSEVSPRVCLDHGYSSLVNGKGKYYDFTVYIYKD